MNFEVDRQSSGWAHIALCADPTWASEPPDAFILANQRLWAQHCRISQVLRESTTSLLYSQCERSDNANVGGKSAKDVIPESRLAQFYGDFFYDDAREKCYSNVSNKSTERCNGNGYESSGQTECWMLPEVEYWFKKLMHDNSEHNTNPRRRRQYKMLAEDDFERWVPSEEKVTEETTLEARIRGVRALWQQNFPQTTNQEFTPRSQSPPNTSRKIRARRRQPRRLASFATPAPSNCMGNQLLCDSLYKFQLDVSRQPPLKDFRRALGRLSNNYQTTMRGTASRCPLYRGTQVSRYTPTCQRPVRSTDKKYGIWWPRENTSAEVKRFNIKQNSGIKEAKETEANEDNANAETNEKEEKKREKSDGLKLDQTNKGIENHEPSTSALKIDIERKKRLYSTVLSMTPPCPINVTSAGSVRLTQKFTPGLIKLNPKIVFSARPRISNTNKFEELEKQALEQYKPSDESIDTKFRELERQAEEQYSTSNSNTSCGSENSTNTKVSQETQTQSRKSEKSHKEKPVDSVVIYSQNFPDLNCKGRTKSIANLKNFHTPPRGEKKEQIRRMNKTVRNLKHESPRAASDTDYDGQNFTPGVHKNSFRWTIHGIHPKKRHLSFSVSDLSSDEGSTCGTIKDARLLKKYVIKAKMFAHGAGGDLQRTKKSHRFGDRSN